MAWSCRQQQQQQQPSTYTNKPSQAKIEKEKKKKILKQELKRRDSVPDNLFNKTRQGKAGRRRDWERDHPSCGPNSAVKCVIHYTTASTCSSSSSSSLIFFYFLRRRENPSARRASAHEAITHRCSLMFSPSYYFLFLFRTDSTQGSSLFFISRIKKKKISRLLREKEDDN